MCAVVSPSHIVCANVGDSRCYIGSGDKCVVMTDDHKPNNPEELQRITACGGFVEFNRVNGCLAMSRALGDFEYKKQLDKPIHEQLVIPVPDITVHERSAADELLLLACDGIWDVLSGSEALGYISSLGDDEIRPGKKIKLVANSNKPNPTCEDMASALINLALSAGSTDNLSALVVKLN